MPYPPGVGAGAVWDMGSGVFIASNSDGVQAAYDAAKAALAAIGGVLYVGPGLEGLTLGSLPSNVSMMRVTNNGIYGIGRMAFLDPSNANLICPGTYTDATSVLSFPAILELHNKAATRYRGDLNPTGTDFVIYSFDDTGLVELPVSFGLSRYVSISPTRMSLVAAEELGLLGTAGTSGQVCTSRGAGLSPSWQSIVLTNALLDGVNHTDTLAGAVARGDIIVGNSTPKWARLAKGAADTFLGSDGTDVSWRTAAAIAALVSHDLLAHLKPIRTTGCTWNNGSTAISTTGGQFANVKVGDYIYIIDIPTAQTQGAKVATWTDSNNINADISNTGASLSPAIILFIPGDHFNDTAALDTGTGAGLFLTFGRGNANTVGGTTFQEIRGPIRWMGIGSGSIPTFFQVAGSTSTVTPNGFGILKQGTTNVAYLHPGDLTGTVVLRLGNPATGDFFVYTNLAQTLISKVLDTGNDIRLDETGGLTNGSAFRDRSSPTKGFGLDLTGITAGQNRVAKIQDISQAGHLDHTYVSRTTGIDAKATGTTTLFTVPSGKSFIVTRLVVRCTAATAITVGPTYGVGVAAGEDDIVASAAHTAFQVADTFVLQTPKDPAVVAASTQAIKLGIDTAATGTSMTLAVDLCGYLV